MRSVGGFVAAALVAIALTGCAAAAPETASAPAPSPSADREIEAAPATVTPTAAPEIDLDAYFLESSLVSQIDLSDDEKLSAAKYACEQVEGGAAVDEVVAVEGINANLNSAFVRDAIVVFCSDAADL